MKESILLFCISSILFLTTFTFALNNKLSCKKSPAEGGVDQVDIHCSCMEQIIEFKEALHKLIVNQTGCTKNVLKLDWGTLQSHTKVKVIVFVHASVVFDDEAVDMGNSSIVEAVFDHSNFIDIPEYAFTGLRLLETMRILNSKIEIIRPKAFSGFHSLKTIEFAHTNITRIEKDAFIDLPQTEFLAFVKCRIGTIESDAIHILNPPTVLENKECRSLPPTPASSLQSRALVIKLFSDVNGRSLQSLQNIRLPEFGGKLFFFASEILRFETSSINSKLFSYIILGGNNIELLEKNAFEAQLENECDVSALLMIGNNFTVIESNPFLGVTGNQVKPSNTVIGVIDNAFKTVFPKGFSINDNLETFSIHGNTFKCDCGAFPWILSNQNSEAQRKLEKTLVETSRCSDDTRLADFLKSCDGLPIPAKPNNEDKTTENPLINGSEGHTGNGGYTLAVWNLLVISCASYLIAAHAE